MSFACVLQSALQSSPWGLMQALETQVGELRVDGENYGACDVATADAGDSRPSSGNVWQNRGPQQLLLLWWSLTGCKRLQ